jgi:hypothetical protein
MCWSGNLLTTGELSNRGSSLLGVAVTNAPACEREFLLAEPTFECHVWQHGAKWHWQVVNDFEQVLASGVAENKLAARNAAILKCFQRLGNHSGPH